MYETRGKSPIVAEILEACMDVTSLSNIANASHTDFTTIKPYLTELIQSGKIETVDGTFYRTTEKDLKLLGISGCFWILSQSMDTGKDRPRLRG